MDQAVIALGTKASALEFDCASHEARPVAMADDAPAVLVFDTAKHRALETTGYNTRFDETRRAAAALGLPHDRLVRAMIGDVERLQDDALRRRARHVVTEQGRVEAAVAAILAREWPRVGELLDASHASLRRDFEVSCDELDLAVSLLRRDARCYGARMTGGGFGGCAVALVAREAAHAVLEALTMDYQRQTGLAGRGFVAISDGGVRRC
jgi:galactokinase